jgi:hypothetical protein
MLYYMIVSCAKHVAISSSGATATAIFVTAIFVTAIFVSTLIQFQLHQLCATLTNHTHHEVLKIPQIGHDLPKSLGQIVPIAFAP